MSDTSVAHQRDAEATGARTFNSELFNERMAGLGHDTEDSRAAAAGIGRSTLYRWREDISIPGLHRAAEIAARLGVTVDDLFPPAARATTIPAQRGTR